MTLEFVEGNARVKVKASKAKNEFCSEFLLFGNTNIDHFENIFFQGNYTFDFKLDSKNFETETKYNGL
jgi:predicted secreted acid phosphatase